MQKRKINQLIIIVFIISVNSLSLSQNRDIFTMFSTLNSQISENLENISDRDSITAKLKSYIDINNPEMLKGLKMILAEDIYKKYTQLNSRPFVMDGNPSEWINVPDLIRDIEGDTPYPNADLVEFRCYLDSDYNLHTLYKTKAKPKRISGEESLGLTIFNANNPNREIELRFAEIGHKSHFYIFNQGNKRWHRIEVPYSFNSVFEAKIPLSQIFRIAGIEKTNTIYVKPFIRHPKRRDAAAFLQVMQKQKNYALILLLQLLKNNLIISNDTITLALVLANNWLYSVGDDNVKKEIISDCRKHLEFYKKILQWQKQQIFKYPLADVPVIIKAYWANRITKMDAFNSSMDISRYKEFVDRIETLEQFHELVIRNSITEDFTFPSQLKSIIWKIDRFMWDSMDYRLNYYTFRDVYYLTGKYKNYPWGQESAELFRNNQYWIEFFGVKRDLHGFMWANYQLRRFKEKGKFIGDCGTHSITTMIMQKAIGIPSGNCSWDGHAFSVYFNPFFNKWESVTTYHLKRPNRLKFDKVKWHHKVFRTNLGYYDYHYLFYENTSARLLKNLTRHGLDYTVFEKIFLSGLEEVNGMLFNNQTAPDILPDTDNDGIPNYIEHRLGLNPNNPDTDNDGYADLWEIERGFNPLSNKSPKKEMLFVFINHSPFSFISKLNGKAIDSAHTESNTPLGLYRFHGKLYQLFKAKISDELEYYHLISLKSGNAITISEEGNLINQTLTHSDNQKWKIVPSGNGAISIISKSKGKALGVSIRGGFQLFDPVNSENCKWIIRFR